MGQVVYVVPCGAAKVDHAASAGELYLGSMFKYVYEAATELAAEDGGRVLILSALYGLLDPTDVVEPYNVKMGDKDEVRTAEVSGQAHWDYGIDFGDEVYAFLPKAYLAKLDEALRPWEVYAQNVYEAAPGIGYQRGTVANAVRQNDAVDYWASQAA